MKTYMHVNYWEGEGKLDTLCSMTAAVLAPRELRLARIQGRDGITKAEAERRMASQHDDHFFQQHADEILDGSAPAEQIPALAAQKLQDWLGKCI